MSQQHQLDSDPLDNFLTLLSDQYCRLTLEYFGTAQTEVTPLQELATDISTKLHGDVEQVAIRLQHTTLPRLAAADALLYDAESQAIHYHGHPELETLLESITAAHPDTDR